MSSKKCFCLDRDVKNFYSDAVIHGDLAYICGQMSLDPETDAPVHGDICQETTLMLSNFDRVLHGIGCTKDDVLSVTVYMTKDEDFDGYNKVYGEYFGSNFPVRSTVTVQNLFDGLRVEMTAIVAVPQAK